LYPQSRSTCFSTFRLCRIKEYTFTRKTGDEKNYFLFGIALNAPFPEQILFKRNRQKKQPERKNDIMVRNIITIDEEKCTGCKLCIPNCPEGAIQVIDNKARLVSDLMCDGLGACLGHCPEGAITIVEREAEDYDERKVMANIVKQGPNTVLAHLTHLKYHGQTAYYNQALAFLKDNDIPVPTQPKEASMHDQSHEDGCPGSRAIDFSTKPDAYTGDQAGKRTSELTHWPIQMHLINPKAPYFQGADLLLAADCTAFALGDFHAKFLKNRKVIIACPKLDDGQGSYVEKIKALIDDAKINTLTVIIMQVPCCGGLLHLAKTAAAQATRKVPIKNIVVGLKGEILKE
jgi:ferredoxin